MRNTGTVQQSTLESNIVDWAWFVKFELPSPVGTKRFTDCRLGDQTLDIDGTSQLWTETGITVGGIKQSKNGILSVAFLDIINLDFTWNNWALTPGIKRSKVTVYVGQWVAGVPPVYDGSYEIFTGNINDHETGPIFHLSLKPLGDAFGRKINARIMGSSCLSDFKDPDTCQYPGADVNCAHTRSACSAKANLANFLGWDFVSPLAITWGRASQPPVYYPPPPPPPTYGVPTPIVDKQPAGNPYA